MPAGDRGPCSVHDFTGSFRTAGMNAGTAIRAVSAAARGRHVVFSSGTVTQIAKRVAHGPHHLYLDGPSMFASSVGIGAAWYARNTTIVIDDPDSVLTNLAALVTAGMLTDLPLVHIVLDGPHAVADHCPDSHDRTDLCALAMAAGYPRTHTIERLDKLAELVRQEIVNCPSPVFVRCALAESTSRALACIGRHLRLVEPPDSAAYHVEAA